VSLHSFIGEGLRQSPLVCTDVCLRGLRQESKKSDQLKHFCGCESDERSPSASDLFAHKRRRQDSFFLRNVCTAYSNVPLSLSEKGDFKRLSSRAAERTQCSILFRPSTPEAPPPLQSKQLQTTTLQNKKRAGKLQRRSRYLSAHGNSLVVCNKVLRRRRSPSRK